MQDSVTTESKTIQITIDDDSGIPIWLQLRNRLIYLITSGYYATGDKLPTVREMAVDLGINYNTVSKVYQDIERDGYIVSKRGRGTFVRPTTRRSRWRTRSFSNAASWACRARTSWPSWRAGSKRWKGRV